MMVLYSGHFSRTFRWISDKPTHTNKNKHQWAGINTSVDIIVIGSGSSRRTEAATRAAVSKWSLLSFCLAEWEPREAGLIYKRGQRCLFSSTRKRQVVVMPTTKKPIADRCGRRSSEPGASPIASFPLFNYVQPTTHWFLMYQLMTALQYCCRQPGRGEPGWCVCTHTWQGRAGITEEGLLLSSWLLSLLVREPGNKLRPVTVSRCRCAFAQLTPETPFPPRQSLQRLQ